tara:strand:+ start:853 stop:1380 length:528 start_codon:yes stop_codon:yes gene_type:complete
VNISNNFFEIFSLQQDFDLDTEALTAQYKKLQSQSHPDRFSGADDASRLQALQQSSIINDAFETLKSPVKRAAYLLSLNGIDPEEHNQSHLSAALLMQQMEWRDELESATGDEDMDTLERLKQEVETEKKVSIDEFRKTIKANDFTAGKAVYHKLQFVEKMLSEINHAEEKILDY